MIGSKRRRKVQLETISSCHAPSEAYGGIAVLEIERTGVKE
jgi:hypothetical protein